jgi:pimeloyl-ACP methyl ester carboxylesterase
MRTLTACSSALLIALFTTVPTLETAARTEGHQPAAGQTTASRLAAAADQTFTKEGVTLRYKEFGSGDPVMLIHGYTASLESMTGLANTFTEGHRVIAMDVRGFGRSSKFADATRFGHLIVDDVVGLMDHLKVSRAHLVGHSMGALIAANVAARYPARVSSATLIAGPFYADKQAFAKAAAPWIADLEGGKGLANFIAWLFPRMDPKMVGGISGQIMKSNDLPSLIAVLQSLPGLAIIGLNNASVGTLVAVGSVDPLQPLSQRFSKSSPGAKLLEIEGADHLTIVASPDVLRAMRELMQSATSRSQPIRDAA